jgi:hypothetical protein
MPTSSASRAIIESRVNMNPPEKPLTDAEVDALYGLEPVIEGDSAAIDKGSATGFTRVACPYCGEEFETSVDASAGLCSYVEDCQVCCQPIEMELRVDENGAFQDLVLRRGDA